MSTTTQISRPAPFVEELGTELGKQVIAQQGIPLVAQTVAGLGMHLHKELVKQQNNLS